MRHIAIALSLLLLPLMSARAQVSVGIGFPGINIGINVSAYPHLVPVPGYPVYYDPEASWSRDWEAHRRGWDHWDRRSVPSAAPLPSYQRQYSGDRYPHEAQQQHSIQAENYRYKPREAVTQRWLRSQGSPAKPSPGRQQQVPPARRSSSEQAHLPPNQQRQQPQPRQLPPAQSTQQTQPRQPAPKDRSRANETDEHAPAPR